MKSKSRVLLSLLFFFMAFTASSQSVDHFNGTQAERDSLKNTSIAIRDAFSKGDVDLILAFHHPDVIKATSYKSYQTGRESLRPGLKGTLDNFHLEFIENNTESLFINGDTAIEQTLFTIKGTPKKKGLPFIFKGRSMIVYVKYKDSPTGWATIREMIQPATEN
jgi:ketosteroid isomerase-like protein